MCVGVAGISGTSCVSLQDTEIVYVHSKLMIVDDCISIIGSGDYMYLHYV